MKMRALLAYLVLSVAMGASILAALLAVDGRG
jgi:hypothetical protein